MRQWVHDAEIVATCRVAYTEVVSALDKRHKRGDLSSTMYNRVYEAFTTDWPNIAALDFNDIDSGQFVKKYGLNRLAAMHLSAAKIIQNHATAFSSTDDYLCRAAAAEGLRVLSYH